MAVSYPWVEAARKLLGVKELPGYKHNPKIVEMWSGGHAGNYRDDETPWCAAFVSDRLETAGIRSARSGWARSYLKWGVHLPQPVVGAIVVFERGPTAGHVGFVMGKDARGNLLVLGGNQSDAVTIAPFATNRVLGYRWPSEQPLPDMKAPLTVIKTAAVKKLSTNEA